MKLTDFIVIWERKTKTTLRGFDVRVQFDGLNWSRTHLSEGMTPYQVATELRDLAARIEQHHAAPWTSADVPPQ